MHTRSPLRKRYLVIATTVAIFLIGWISILVRYGPETVVEFIGVENAYLATLLLAATGGLSSLTAGPFYATLATFAAGGVDPYLLGIIAGIGISIGDSLFFVLGRRGLTQTRLNNNPFVARLRAWLERAPQWTVPLTAFVYTSATPFPNDVLMVSLGLLRQYYWLIIPFVLAGNILHTTIITTGASVLPEWLL